MNKFYGILKIEEKSDVVIDYYNKCKMSFEIKCSDKSFCSIIVVKEKLLSIYPYLNIGMYIYVLGYVVSMSSDIKIVADEIVLL